MLVTRSEIVTAIHSIWPNLIDDLPNPSNIFIPRNEYWAPSKDDFQEFINMNWAGVIKNIHYDIVRWACSNYAAALAVQADLFVLWKASLNKFSSASMREWSVMEVWGTKFKGNQMSHAINLIYMDDRKLWLFEPQSDWKAWLADAENDIVHFIKQ